MKISMVLIGLFVCGCVSQTTGLTQKEGELDIFYEEPDRNFEELGPIIVWSPYNQEKDARKKVLAGAVELDADGIIIRFSGNTLRDRSIREMYKIEATAVRYPN